MQNNTLIRDAIENDLTEVLRLLKELGYNAEDSSELRNVWQKINTNQSMGIVVAVTDDIVSGYLAYSVKPQLRLVGLSMEIDELSVSTSLRGCGIGSKLISHVKKIAIDQGTKQIILSTNKERDSYRRGFYTKNGFIEKNSAWMKIDLSEGT